MGKEISGLSNPLAGIPMIVTTKRLELRPLETSDAQFLADLINDPEVRSSLGAYDLIAPVSIDYEEKWVENVATRNDQTHLMIQTRRASRPIGMVSTKDINRRTGSVHVTIMLERASWGKGYGEEALGALVGFLFDSMNAHRVWLRVDARNERAIKCYEKCGFRKEGTLREDNFADGQWQSSHIMSVLSHEYGGGKR